MHVNNMIYCPHNKMTVFNTYTVQYPEQFWKIKHNLRPHRAQEIKESIVNSFLYGDWTKQKQHKQHNSSERVPLR